MKQDKSLHAVVAGHVCLDITPNFYEHENKKMNEIIMPGKLVKFSGAKLSTGGAAANTGMALSRLGVKTQIVGKVGSDYLGDIFISILENEDKTIDADIVKGGRTSFSIILVPNGLDRVLLHDPGANDDFGYDDIDYGALRGSALFHFGYPPVMRKTYLSDGLELTKIFKKVKSFGLTTSLDMCLPDPMSEAGKVNWRKLLENTLPYVDIFAPSIEEILYMVDREYYHSINDEAGGNDVTEVLDVNRLPALGDSLIEMGAKIVLIKCGQKGMFLRTANASALAGAGRAMSSDAAGWASRELFEESFEVPEVMSATGAGDTSIAGFIAAFMKGLPAETALKAATGAGAQCVTEYDAISGIMPFDETLDKIKSGWKKKRTAINGSYFEYDRDNSVWVGKKDKQ